MHDSAALRTRLAPGKSPSVRPRTHPNLNPMSIFGVGAKPAAQADWVAVLVEACKEACENQGEPCWILIVDDKLEVLGEASAPTSMLKMTATKKAKAVLGGVKPKDLYVSMCAALPSVLGAVIGVRSTLPVAGAVMLKIPGSEAAVFSVSGNAGPAKDLQILEAALAKAGMVEVEDGVYSPA